MHKALIEEIKRQMVREKRVSRFDSGAVHVYGTLLVVLCAFNLIRGPFSEGYVCMCYGLWCVCVCE